MSAYTTAPKPTLSFYAENHSERLNQVRVPSEAEVERAKNMVFREPDADLLGRMIFGEPV